MLIRMEIVIFDSPRSMVKCLRDVAEGVCNRVRERNSLQRYR